MRNLKTACRLLAFCALLFGIVYPLFITGIAQALFSWRANGSLLPRSPTLLLPANGSELIGQSFSAPGYFHGRPSDCGYDAAGSASSNLGPSNPALFALVRARGDSLRQENSLPPDSSLPADLVLASASGLDPDISPQSALLPGCPGRAGAAAGTGRGPASGRTPHAQAFRRRLRCNGRERLETQPQPR